MTDATDLLIEEYENRYAHRPHHIHDFAVAKMYERMMEDIFEAKWNLQGKVVEVLTAKQARDLGNFTNAYIATAWGMKRINGITGDYWTIPFGDAGSSCIHGGTLVFLVW